MNGHVLSRDTHSVFAAPPGAKVSDVQFGRHVDPCHSSSTSAQKCARSPIHCHRFYSRPTWVVFTSRSRGASSLKSTYPSLSLREGALSPLSEEFVSEGIFSTSAGFRCASLCPTLFCLLLTVPHWSRCAAESGRLCPGLWQTPELPSTQWRRGCRRTVLPRLSWWPQCFAASSKP